MAKSYYKHPQYGSVFCNDAFITPPCRIAFPNLVNPKAPPAPRPGEQPGQPRYELTLLFPKTSKVHNDFLAGIKEVIDDMLKVFNAGRGAKISELAIVKDGDAPYWQTGDNADKYPYYKGQNLLTARNSIKPSTVDMDTQLLDPSTITGGCLVVAIIIPIIVSTGVTYKVKVVQLVKDDGVRFAGGARTDSDYIKMLGSAIKAAPKQVVEEAEESEEVVEEEAPPPPPARKKVGKSSIADLV